MRYPRSVRPARLVALALAALPLSMLTHGVAAPPPASRPERGVAVEGSRGAAPAPPRADAPPRSRAAHTGRTARRELPRERARLAPSERPASVGTPSEGRLVGGVRIDTSKPYLRLVPTYAQSGARFGLPELVRLVERAARVVASQFPGSRLGVADLSLRFGGDVDRHHSHESGRDADLAFYVVDSKGRPVHPESFLPFDGEGRSAGRPELRFDDARNWLLVQSLVTDPGARVSHIFVSEPLRQRLLRHARARGVSQAVLDRAAIALMQPTTRDLHDDHFHVRISCPRSMRPACVEYPREALRRPAAPPARARAGRPGSQDSPQKGRGGPPRPARY